ncbi:MAG: amidohydrolase [Candidatus Bathyarchaeia archaeon]
MLHATLTLLNGKVYTFNPKKPTAQAVAIFEEKIVYVGEDPEASKLIGPQTKVIDLDGKTVLPGFTDCHVHMAGFGRSLSALNLRNVTSITQLKQLIREKSQQLPPGTWILGGGWDQEKFAEKRLPTRWDLDEGSPNNPVVLFRVCTHICVANTKALEKAEIERDTMAPPGGEIDRDRSTGELTGILREKALELIFKAFPKASEEEIFQVCLMACRKAVEAGLTGVHWIIESPVEMSVIQKMRRDGKLPLRVYLLFPAEFLENLEGLGLRQGFGDAMIKIGGLKILLDGSLGSQTAALNEPYKDAPETSGMLTYGQEEFETLVFNAHKAGLQLAVHAIGDKAMDIALKAFEKALEKIPNADHRHRIEHASVLNEELIRRMKSLGAIASVQPHFIVSDFWVEDRLGKKRARWVYPFKSLTKAGVVVCGGSDCPVEPISPLLGIWATVVKQPNFEERLAVEEAIRLYTVNAAYANFEENLRGTIEEGKLADMVVVSDDPFKIKPEKIRDIKVLMTIVGGQMSARMTTI